LDLKKDKKNFPKRNGRKRRAQNEDEFNVSKMSNYFFEDSFFATKVLFDDFMS
jgi:hypothetical protein